MTPERWRQIEKLYNAARERGPEVLASTDPELRREVEELLALDPSGASFLAQPPAEMITESMSVPITAGSQLGPYRIDARLGQGGMGQVFRATDTRLGRAVALKIAHEKFSDRFDREARAIASLNHPHICQLYDVGALPSGSGYLVMELLEGETLAARLKNGKLPIQETLRHGAQIAGALTAAHAKGIIHRDLKPGNIMLGPAGVKVLDFGLAKTGHDATLTATNAVIGTPAYMAPEQAEGQECDARTDIYALGLILYEMATGRRAGEQPSFDGIPDKLAQVTEHCLRKDPRRRFQHADDVQTLLEHLLAELDSRRPAAAKRIRGAGVALAASVALAAAGIWVWMQFRGGVGAPTETPVVRLTSDNGMTVDPAVSPDGKLLAYASDRATGENLDIWVQQIDGGAPLRLTSGSNTEDGPSFSPDGSRIVYRSDDNSGVLYTIPALGGEPRFLAQGGRHARFSPDGTQVAYATGLGSGTNSVAFAPELFVIPSMGGTPRKLVPADVGGSHPIWSPDGKWILFAAGTVSLEHWALVPSDLAQPITVQQYRTAFQEGQAGSLTVLTLDAQRKSGLTDFVPCQWLPDNRVLFTARSGDTAHVFEIRLAPPGFFHRHWHLDSSQQRLTFGTAYDESASLAGTGSPARRMVFTSETRSEELWSADLDTNHPRLVTTLRRLTQEGGFHTFPTVSRDGSKVAFISHTAYNDEVWLLDLPAGKRTLLSNTVSTKLRSRISPDGSQVFFRDAVGQPDCAADDSCHGVYVVPAAGGAPRLACDKCYGIFNLSPDGKRIADGFAFRPISVVDLETGRSTPLLAGHKSYQTPTWSPDGRWIAFGVNERPTLYARLYIAPYTPGKIAPEDAWIPITDGSTVENNYSWSPDGNWLYSFSGRDRYPCLWAHPLDPRTKKPIAPPVPVIHLHSARFNNGEPTFFSIQVARDKIIFNRGEITSNVWMTELQNK